MFRLLHTCLRHLFTRLLTTLLWLGLMLGVTAPASAQTTTLKTLVLYDAPAASVDANRLGKAYAIMLGNLLGHWNTTVDLVPVQTYTTGKLNSYDATFYIGSHYDLPLPTSFLTDVSATTKTVVWFKYNLWQYAWNPAFNFTARYGMAFNSLRGLNATPSAQAPAPGFFDTVSYKGQTLKKFYDYSASTGAVMADPDIGAITQQNPLPPALPISTVPVSISNPVTGESLPYIVRAGNFWYVADLPLSYIGPRDRYLVLCDQLHDMLGVTTPVNQRALVRFEDVSHLVTPSNTRALTDYLRPRNIPFGIAVVPHYRDPLGIYNNGVAEDVPFASSNTLRTALNYMLPRGGRMVAHGWTHQYAAVRNPWTGVSADDFEFWDNVNNRPLAEDSQAWALGRIDAAIQELGTGTYKPFAFEIPHYQGSPNAYAAVRQRFATSWGRLVYYTSTAAAQPDLTASNPDRDFAVGQFFPYVIRKDYYNNKVLPENLGNIEYDLGTLDPSSNYNYTAQDILLNADKATVVRDGWAVFFFHPFWLEASLGKPGLADFQAVITGITARGFVWTDPATL
jgi:uncharacterized protein YdaL